MKSILIAGGAGFIGSSLAVAAVQAGHRVTCLDNLSRRGTELLLNRIREHGCSFAHGDVRNSEDLAKLKGDFDVLVECSAEPSVLVGTQGDDARYLINNNLLGSVNCFEFARLRSLPVIFLSTSRVYPYSVINRLRFCEMETRFEYAGEQAGVSQAGITTDFPLTGYRSLYGASKLSAEHLLAEYSGQYDLPTLINRCGVIAGPWQLGKVDQGIFTFWLASHHFRRPLSYIGYGGQGKQVRDVLHIDDLVCLLLRQIDVIEQFRGAVFNVGGARASSLSLCEATLLCRRITGQRVDIGSDLANRPADVIWYISDNEAVREAFQWQPEKSAEAILGDIYAWLTSREAEFSRLFQE